MAEAVIFEVNIQDSLSKLAGLREQLDDIKASQKNLDQAFKDGTIAGEDYRKTSEALKIVTKNVSSEYRSAQRLLEGYTGAQKENIDTTNFANNSVRQNRLLLKQLTEQYNDAKNPTAAFANQIKALSDTLKQQESAIGDNRRSVGGYADGIKQAFGELRIGNVQLSTLSEGLKGATNGFKAAGGGVKGFSAALATTGLPIIILGVQQLIGVFEKFKPVADAVEESVTALSAAFNALISGGNIKEAVNQSLELLNTLRDLEDTQEAFNLRLAQGKNEIDRLVIASRDRSKSETERIELLQRAEALEKQFFNEQVSRNEVLRKQQEATLLSKLKISKEELRILATTSNFEDANFQRIKSRVEASKAFNEDELKAFQATLNERVRLDGESLKFAEKRTNERNKLIEKEEEEQKKAAERRRQLLEKEQKEREAYLANLSKLQDEFNLSEREKLVKWFDDKLATIKGANDSELQLIKNINKAKTLALQKFDEDAAKRREAERKKIADEQSAILTQQFNEQIQFNQKQAELDQLAVDLSVVSEEEKAARKKEIQLRALEEQLALTREFFGADGVITQEELQGIRAIELAIQKLRQTASQPTERTLGDAIGINKEQQGEILSGLQTISDAFNSVSQVINAGYQVRLNEIENVKNAEISAIRASGKSEEEKAARIQEIERNAAKEAYDIQQKQFETNKALQIVNAIIAGALGVVNAFQLGPIAGAIAAVAIAATTAAQIAVIATQKAPPPPAFADGGKVLSGQVIGANDGVPIHRSNGDNLLATVKTGEVILNERQQAALGGAATFRRLGVPGFASGGLVGDGGFSVRSMTRTSEERAFMAAAIRNGFANAPQPIVTVEEINRVSDSSQRSVAVSEL